jgi:hypothetical protein
MRSSSQQYSELLVEEKQDEGQADSMVNDSRWGRKATTWTISMVALAFLLLLGLGIGTLVSRTPSEKFPAEDANAEWLAHASRASGDQYLLGVGKADITG